MGGPGRSPAMTMSGLSPSASVSDAEDGAADVDVVALGGRLHPLFALRLHPLDDRERRVADLPVAALAPDRDAAAAVVRVPAVVEIDDGRAGLTQRRRLLGAADAEIVGLASAVGHDVRR